jgi:RNA polymerase sigma-70 factor (ECF subfamily)
MCYLFDSQGIPERPARTRAAGDSGVQAEELYDSIRTGLIAMVPRLMRFAALLAGERQAGAKLLGRALRGMLSEEHRYQRGTPLDGWAFGEIYRLWLEELRAHADPIGQGRDEDASFASLFRHESGTLIDAFTIDFLRGLPPPHRLTLLLVYGERFDHAAAGLVLDVSAETIGARLLRLSAGLADQLTARAPAPPLETAADLQEVAA